MLTTLMYSAGILFVLIIGLFALTKNWIAFGLKYFIGNWKEKGEIGLVFVRNYGNNLGFPLIVPLKESKVNDKMKPRIYTKDMFTDGYFWGKPFMIVDANDMLSTYGLYKIQVDSSGVPIYETVIHEYESDGVTPKSTKLKPALSSVKNSTVLAPETLKAAIAGEAMNSNLFDLGKQIKTVLIVAGIAALAAAIAAYFAFGMPNNFHDVCSVALNNRFDQLAGQMLEVSNVCASG